MRSTGEKTAQHPQDSQAEATSTECFAKGGYERVIPSRIESALSVLPVLSHPSAKRRSHPRYSASQVSTRHVTAQTTPHERPKTPCNIIRTSQNTRKHHRKPLDTAKPPAVRVLGEVNGSVVAGSVDDAVAGTGRAQPIGHIPVSAPGSGAASPYRLSEQAVGISRTASALGLPLELRRRDERNGG